MSQQAERVRSIRQHFAAPGSSFDKIVRVLRIALPMIIGVLAAFLALAPFTGRVELSFVLDRDKVDIAKQRIRVEQARYRGEDRRGRPFSLTANEAVQRSSKEPVLDLEGLTARILLNEGPAQINANNGRYDMQDEKVDVDGPVQVEAAGGYRLTTSDVTVDLDTRTLQSRKPVDGRTNLGTFSADRLRVDLPERRIMLDGNARLRIVQNGLRGG